jgi:hypothetical protein
VALKLCLRFRADVWLVRGEGGECTMYTKQGQRSGVIKVGLSFHGKGR